MSAYAEPGACAAAKACGARPVPFILDTREARAEYAITKHGQPVTRLVPRRAAAGIRAVGGNRHPRGRHRLAGGGAIGSARVVPSEGLLLLDTHVWIWLNTGDTRRLGTKAIARMTRAAGRGAPRLSIISVWEVGLLHARGRIRFSTSLDEWVRSATATPGLSLADLTPEIALDASRLPGDLHADHVDRLLTSTARHAHATLVTRDERLLGYAAEGWIKAVDART